MQALSTPFLAINNIRRRPFRNLCLAAVVALLAFLLIGGSLLTVSLFNGTSSTSARLGADAMLVPSGYEQKVEGALLRGEPSAFYFDGALVSRLLAVDGIERASPQLFIASFDSPHCSAEVQMIGYEPSTDFVISPWLSRQLPGGPSDGEVVIGSSINGKPGDKLLFFSATYQVSGKLERTGMGFDTSVFVNMKTARAALEDYAALGGENVPDGPDAVSSVIVELQPGVDSNGFARSIRYSFRKEGVGVVLTQAMLSNVSQSLHALIGIILALIISIWLLALGVLAVLFTVTTHERKREFGVYRALGATRRRLTGLILSESAVVSLAGALMGTALLSFVYFSFAPLIGISVHMPYLQPSGATLALLLGSGLLLSFVTGPLASLYAAAQIGRLAVGAILREGE
jgi:putative ABC transport system permease protein